MVVRWSLVKQRSSRRGADAGGPSPPPSTEPVRLNWSRHRRAVEHRQRPSLHLSNTQR